MSPRTLTPAQVAARAKDILRLKGLTAALSESVSDSYIGFDCRASSDRPARMIDPQEQREAALLEHGSDDLKDPAFRDWCRPARLKLDFADPDMGVKYLREHDLQGQAESADDEIESAIHAAIYRTETQERNRHDRLMVDVPKNGRRKGGTHGLPPERRRTRSAKVINSQLLRWDTPEPEEECLEAERFYRSVNAKIARSAAYVLSIYTGTHADVLNISLQGKSTKEIADALGKTTRRIRQIVHGNAQRNAKGLHQIIDEVMQVGVPADFQCNAPVLVQPVHTLKKFLQKEVVLGQLGWDFDALMGVAA
jgi:DNA-binding CsgD family transcriptional regulator